MKLEIKIKSLSHEEQKLNFLNNLDIKIENKGLILLKGKTGSGKTTLLKVICGIIPSIQKAEFSGEVKIDGKLRDISYLREVMSLSLQEPAEQFLMSDIKNEILFNLNSQESKRALELLSFFNLDKNGSVKDLSAGQKKIISLIPILASKKHIKLFDEPSSNLDLNNKLKLKSVLKELKKENIIIISSHEDLFDEIADKDIYLDKPTNIKEILFQKKINLSNKLISLNSISIVSPDKFFFLNDLSLDIFSGEIFGIFGSNGSGKTTLINIISKRIKPKSGSVKINGSARMDLVMQEPEKQFFANSVLGEIMLSGKLSSQESNFLLEKFGLEHKKNLHPFFLSRGEKQLVLVIAALTSKPDVIIFDELLTGIDSENSKKILNLIREYYSKYHPTIILTDQNDGPFEGFVSNKICLDDFKLNKYAEGLVHEIYRKGDLIYKKVKDNFKDFNNSKHFITEKKVHDLIKENNLPSVEMIKIEKIENKYYLVERLIKGYQKKKGELSNKEINDLLKFVKKVHRIKIKGYGLIEEDLVGKFSKWEDYLNELLKNNLNYLTLKNLIRQDLVNNLRDIFANGLNSLRYSKKGSLIITDLNPLNFFFNKEKLIGSIDIDHPISGDPLYEYGAMKWYHKDMFDQLIKTSSFGPKKIKKILLYELFHGISVVCWMNRNNLEVNEELKKLNLKIKTIISNE